MRKSLYTAKQKNLLSLLREIRLEAGLSQVEVAKRLQKPQSFVSKYEAGDRRLDLVELDQVCEAIGIAVEEFVRRYAQQRSQD